MKHDNLTEEIKARIDIVELITEHVDLKRAGQNFKGLCPFHTEKTPSFMVSPSKQIFHCFGCNKGGDIFAFIMNYENMTFQEALSFLSNKAGLKIEDFRQGQEINKSLKENLYAVQKEDLTFFKNNLNTSKQALSYLNERGLKPEIIEMFSLGFSKNEKDALLRHLGKQGFSAEHIKASGLVYYGESGAYDFFRDRLMFPIFDLQGRVVAFGGRTFSSSKTVPKYINSPDSAIFKKGELSYGLNIAKNFITQKGYSMVVEGYFDAIMCHQYGFSNAVAPLGTALTAGHLKRLKRFSNKVLLIFDGDSAGISAARRALETVYSEGITAKVVMLSEGEDPDTFLRKHGEEKFRKYITGAVSPVQFLLRVYGKNKLDTVRYMLHLISLSPDKLQKDETIRELSERSKIHEMTLRDELKNISQKLSKTSRSADDYYEGSQKTAPLNASVPSNEEKILLNIVILMPEKTQHILSRIDKTGIENHIVKGLFEKIENIKADAADKNLFFEKLLNTCNDEEQKLITGLSIKSEINEDNADKIIEDCLRMISMRRLEKQIKLAGEMGDEKLLHALITKKNKMLQKIS